MEIVGELHVWDLFGSLYVFYPGNSESGSEGLEFRLGQDGMWQITERQNQTKDDEFSGFLEGVTFCLLSVLFH